MKLPFFAATLLALLAASASAQQKPEPTPPKPVAPVSAPLPGMKWQIVVAKNSSDPNPMVISGMRGDNIRVDSAKLGNGSVQTWYSMLGRIFFLRNDELVEAPVADGNPSASTSFHVSGFPGIYWVRPGMEAEVVFDKERKLWLAIYQQKAAPWKALQTGDEAIYVPDGPIVDVEASFDALTGLPLRAEVGGKIYTYRVETSGGRDPAVSPALRAGIQAKLRREAALAEAVRRQESN